MEEVESHRDPLGYGCDGPENWIVDPKKGPAGHLYVQNANPFQYEVPPQNLVYSPGSIHFGSPISGISYWMGWDYFLTVEPYPGSLTVHGKWSASRGSRFSQRFTGILSTAHDAATASMTATKENSGVGIRCCKAVCVWDPMFGEDSRCLRFAPWFRLLFCAMGPWL